MRSTDAEFIPRMISRLSPVQIVWLAQFGFPAIAPLARNEPAERCPCFCDLATSNPRQPLLSPVA